MSYILDAIKKTESGQKDGDVPNLNSEHQHSAFMEEDETRHWFLPLFVVIAVLFAVVLWLLLKPVPGETNHDKSITQSAQNRLQQDASAEESLVETESATVAVNNQSINDMRTESMTVSETAGLVIKKAPLEVQQPAVQLKQEQVVEMISRRPITEVIEQAETQQPVQVRQTSSRSNKPEFLAAIDHDHWPTLIYTTHIYATKPEDRFVMLNGKAYSIGDSINKSLKVVDILENDLLVDYQGQKVIVPSLTDVNP